ncbi:Arm DNA-binding domain-containing protein [Salmonella enterica]|uniref:Arm DNA-binding domain-containing protein n=1 Tax=Salmonella enterica TaxID=28901 RepID=UPI0003BD99EB|nr:Arm DNA-binding domain-containing protein [Salmonella enterica]ESJ30080.1 integrase [Salmonella enterica subsp. enterica serovar Nchanga str. CFSAN001092]ESJ33426.1 integrase [Salmonella enterica subsp. enterica serovar Nchanga str. CFSAN001091]
MALTDTAIRKIKSTEKSFKITDSLGPNLLLKPNGSKLWYMKYRIDGKEKKLAFGPYPDGYRGGMMPRRIPCSRRQPVPRTV